MNGNSMVALVQEIFGDGIMSVRGDIGLACCQLLLAVEMSARRARCACAHAATAASWAPAAPHTRTAPDRMQAINFYMNVERIKGTEGDDRVIITFNGKVGWLEGGPAGCWLQSLRCCSTCARTTALEQNQAQHVRSPIEISDRRCTPPRRSSCRTSPSTRATIRCTQPRSPRPPLPLPRAAACCELAASSPLWGFCPWGHQHPNHHFTPEQAGVSRRPLCIIDQADRIFHVYAARKRPSTFASCSFCGR
jgi:hypothetical protein